YSNGPATIRQSSISGNTGTVSSGGAGGLASNGTLTMVNSTISGNSAPQDGGGMTVGGGTVASLYNVTIANNIADSDGNNMGDGGGIRIGNGTVNLHHTIISANVDNSPSMQHPDCSGSFVSKGYNLIENTTGCTLSGNNTGNKLGVAAKLAPLADHGGSTLTYALPVSSPAVDAGNPAGCSDPKGLTLTDGQSGYARPINVDALPGKVCDIGALERLSPVAPTHTPSPTATSTTPATETPTDS